MLGLKTENGRFEGNTGSPNETTQASRRERTLMSFL